MKEVEKHVDEILRIFGVAGDKKTPVRVAKALEHLLSGYKMDAKEIVGDAIYPSQDNGKIVSKVEFLSLCLHHVLPFYGTVTITYNPNMVVLGISKIHKIVDIYAKRLQMQEQLTRQVADALDFILKPKGLVVEITASHLCVEMRGYGKSNYTTQYKIGEL